ncbi:hypothetical protein [Aeromonas salmonicida]
MLTMMFRAKPIRQMMNAKAMKFSRLSLSDLLKHQHPIAAGINASVKLKLNALSASTMHPIASNSHIAKTSLKKASFYSRHRSLTRAAIPSLAC